MTVNAVRLDEYYRARRAVERLKDEQATLQNRLHRVQQLLPLAESQLTEAEIEL